MCAKSNIETTNAASVSVSSVASEARAYMDRKKSINELNLKKPSDIEIALYCLEHKSSMLADFNVNDVDELAVLKRWVRKDYKRYLQCLLNDIDHTELLGIYISKKFAETKDSAKDITLIKSYDKKTILSYKYETKKGEAFCYFDKILGVPTTLATKANMKFKLINAKKLVEKIDVDIQVIDLAITANFLSGVVTATIRDTILDFIKDNRLSFYDLSRYFTAINKEIATRLDDVLGKAGLEVVDFSIVDIAIPNNTSKILQNQFFAIAEAERIKNYEQRLEQKSLDLYEKKAQIHSKYPEFPVSLTESEKDFALNRYLLRKGRDISLKADIQEEELAVRKAPEKGTVTKVEVKKVQEEEVKTKKILPGLLTLLILGIIAGVVLMVLGMLNIGLIIIGAVVLICGVIAAVKFDNLAGKAKKNIDEDQEQEKRALMNQEDQEMEAEEEEQAAE